MTAHAAPTRTGFSPLESAVRDSAREASRYWWLWLVAGIAWSIVSLVILQFDGASVTTVAVIVGLMFLATAAQNFVVASLPGPMRWVAAIFGVLFLIAGTVCLIRPVDSFAGLADMLGFLFVLVGIWWMISSFLGSAVNPLWWLTLIAGILMTAVGFWTAGQFFIEKAFVLLVFAGIWALTEGITDIVRAFEAREVHQQLTEEG